MRQLNIPAPPDPNSAQFKTNPVAWQRAATDWMQRTKGVVENAHNEVIRPCAQQFIAAAYTTNTAVTGTTTGTDLANALCSLVDTLTQKGILSPSVSRQQ